jgi:hypothetical protein
MKLAYRYSELDKRHEYQVENNKDIFNQWVWFYLGKDLKIKQNEILLPYLFEPTEIIGKYESNSAKQRAEYIIKAIIKHRKIRRIK